MTDWFRASLSFQILSPILVMSVLVVLVCSGVAYAYFSNAMLKSMQAVEQDYLNMQAEELGSTMHRYSQMLYGMVVDSNLIALTARANSVVSTRRAELNQQVRDTMTSYMDSMETLAGTLVLQDGSYIFYSRIFGIREGKNWFAASDEFGEGYTAELQAMCAEAARTRQAVLGVSPFRYRMDGVFFMHMACPVMNLYNREILGTLILSFNTKAIRQIVNPQESSEHISIGILTDASGIILAHPDSTRIGSSIQSSDPAQDSWTSGKNLLLEKDISLMGVKLYRVLDRGVLLGKAWRYTCGMIALVSLVAMAALAVITNVLRRVMRSIRALQRGICVVSCGDMNTQLPQDSQDEIGQITGAFNAMVRQLEQIKRQEQEQAAMTLRALDNQRLAEIHALENQINSHFLYNTLNTINYTAIAGGNLNVSAQIKRLARMLRYTFEKSDGVVTAAREADWLLDYLTLQALRFGNAFDYQITLSPEVEAWPMHKLLLQPFVENAILHGFSGREHDGLLTVRFRLHDQRRMRITIQDNGHGMTYEDTRRLNAMFRGKIAIGEDTGIGLENVGLRIRSYYGRNADVFVRSTPGQGTTIVLLLPRIERQERVVTHDAGTDRRG